VLQRFACDSRSSAPIERIGDRELMELLAADHRPTGLIRVPARRDERVARVILTEIPHDDSPDRVALDQLVAMAGPSG
jgi:hypothetical protein